MYNMPKSKTKLSNQEPQNLISKSLFKIAAEKAHPDTAHEELIIEIRRELGISAKHLTMWLNNKSQPSFSQFSQLVLLLKAHNKQITADSLIQFN
jgi:hypothetical protein